MFQQALLPYFQYHYGKLNYQQNARSLTDVICLYNELFGQSPNNIYSSHEKRSVLETHG